jgi:hypothetical protein
MGNNTETQKKPTKRVVCAVVEATTAAAAAAKAKQLCIVMELVFQFYNQYFFCPTQFSSNNN